MPLLAAFALFLSVCFVFLWGYLIALLKKIRKLENDNMMKTRLEEAFRIVKEETITLKEELQRERERFAQQEKEMLFLQEKYKKRNEPFPIFESMPFGIILLDRKSKVLFINSQAEKLLGVSKNQIEGKFLEEAGPFPKISRLKEFLEFKQNTFSKEILFENDFYISLVVVPLAEETGYSGFLLLLRDTTRERMAERMKTEFVSLAAHQLRTPLSAIKWTLQMLLEGDLGKLTKEQLDIIKKSYQSNERMIRLINDLLELTRLEEGRYLWRPAVMSLEPIVETVVRLFQEKAQEKGVRLIFQKPEKRLPKVKIDAEKMTLAVSNLIDNAIRYTLKGGEVTVSIVYDTKGIGCDIRDTGIGIPANQQRRVFDRFFRAVNAVRLETEGTGLGLYMVKNIIEAHQGNIWFVSEEGRGSTFSFRLPPTE